MKVNIINENNLKLEDIDSTITRIKCFLLNNDNELIVANCNGGVQLPGGHKEDGEEYEETLIREIKEETGIELNKNIKYEPFFEIHNYVKNYRESGKNKISKVVYFFIKTDMDINIQNTCLTDREKEFGFCLKKVKLDNFEEYINSFIYDTQEEINIHIINEIKVAFDELKSHLNTQ